MTRLERVMVGGLAFGLFTLLMIAAVLTPNPDGLGTHQQLGLPPCSTRWLFGIRCPGCGMTTSWSWMMKGNLLQSFRTNTGGALFCLLAMWTIPIASYVALKGRGTREGWFSRYGLIAMLIAVAVTAVDWIWRLYINP